jgi:Asp-tRNA(Asn)/Glu-tRNA(Gln) amidotransferase A subunit family amidase
VALLRSPYWSKIEPAGEAAFKAAAERLTRGGVQVHEIELPAHFGGMYDAQDTIMFGEGRAAFLDEYLIQGARLGPDFIARAENFKGITAAQMIEAYDLAAACRREFEAMFTDFDVVLTPAAPGEAPEGLHTTGDHIFNAMWTLLHVPCLGIPCTQGSKGLPVGIQLVGPRFSDAKLMRIAAELAPLIDAEAPRRPL